MDDAPHGTGWRFLGLFLFGCLVVLLIWWRFGPVKKAADSNAAAAEERVIVARSLDVPVLDGGPDDAAYARGETVKLMGANEKSTVSASLIHSGKDLFVFFKNIPRDATRVIVRVDADHSRDATLSPGDYEFEVESNGRTAARQADANGAMTPLEIKAELFDGKIRSAGEQWSAELRIRLDWLGGFGRVDGLALAVEGNSSSQQRWPKSGDARRPNSWGEMVLGPLPAEGAGAESVFFDGRGGHVVVPYSPALNPRELTIEAWARVVDGGGGTLIGNGRGRSYWMGLGDELKFSPGGAVLNTSNRKLGNTWHHVAVTMDERGARTLYIDGEVDRQAGDDRKDDEGKNKRKSALKHCISDKMLLFGSDRDALEGEKNLHGYVRDLRIWNRVRTRKEIREAAFQRLTGHEPGLVGLWPFTNGLQDLAGGHHAGLVGDASLAREKPEMESFARAPAGPPIAFPKREPTQPWDGAIPLIEKEVKIDGVGNAAEYKGAETIPLEPERKTSMRIAHTRTGVVLFTGFLFGQQNANDGVTIWINGDGARREAPGPTDIRVRISPDGTVESATGDGHDFRPAKTVGISAKTISGPVFAPQEDIDPIKTPWFMSEVHIPWETFGASGPVKQLRFAIDYQGSVLEAARASKKSADEKIEGHWPTTFDPLQPQTWGEANLTPPIALPPGPTVGAAIKPGGSQILKGEASPPPGLGSTPSPTKAAFDEVCPDTLAYSPAYATIVKAKWRHVDPDNHRFVMAEGRISETPSAKVSDDDSPLIHESHDVDTKIDVVPECLWLVLGGDNGEHKLVLETESVHFPAHTPIIATGDAFYHRPWADDHVTVVGDWVFDCGHSAKTEIHPIYLIESDHEEFLPFMEGKPMQLVRTVRVSMNSSPSYQRNANLGSFAFSVDRPWGTKFFLKVKDGDPNLVTATLNGNKVDLVVEPPAPQGEFHYEIQIGALDGLSWPGARLYQVLIPSMIIHNDMDDGLNGSGEWYLAAGVNGHWRQLLWNHSVDNGQKVDFMIAQDGKAPRYFTVTDPASGAAELNIEVTGYEEDSVLAESVTGAAGNSTDDLVAKDRIPFGPLDALAGTGLRKHDTPNWLLNFTVDDITDNQIVVPILKDPLFWGPRLANEPNDTSPTATKIKDIDVPTPGELTTQLTGFLTGAPFSADNLRLLTPDEDWYLLTFLDYADVSAEVATGQVAAELVPISEVPPELADKFGAKRFRLRVFGNPLTTADESYAVTIRRKAKEIEPDPGEADDQKGGRVVDLTKVPPTEVTPPKKAVKGEERYQETAWAWQHVVDDIDFYKVIVPPASKSAVPTFCPFNKPPQFRVRAFGMRLAIPALGLEGDDEIVLAAGTFGPNTPIVVQVGARPGQSRGFYHFEAEWTDALILTEEECKIQSQVEKGKKNRPFFPVPDNPWFYSGKGPGLPDPPMQEDIFSWSANTAYQEILLEAGDAIDSVLFGEAGQSLTARLYDENGVMLAESEAVIAKGTKASETRAGLIPQTRLRADRLKTGGRYLLQLIPTEGSDVSQKKVRIGLQAH